MVSARLRTPYIGMPVFDGFQLPGAAGPIGAFAKTLRGMSPPPDRLSPCALDGAPVRPS